MKASVYYELVAYKQYIYMYISSIIFKAWINTKLIICQWNHMTFLTDHVLL